ncbi:MAG: phosphatase PAP2 family protein, partial [Bacillota bacterium]|nr:phosphatase PAP2 family protein [Bacillota bacterium]
LMDIKAQGYSFPSGHSANSMTAYGSVARCQKKKLVSIIATIIILFVGISRFCVGVHYPTDVLCGWALGLIVIFFIPWLSEKIKKDWILFLILLVVGLPGFFYCTSNDFYTSYGMMLGGFAGFLFEEKFVNFENTRNILRMILRVVIGAGLFFALNTAFKLPFSSAFLESGTTAALLVRAARYAIVIFLLIGVYPMLFKVTDKVWKKK